MESVAEIRFDEKDAEERWGSIREDWWGDLKRETERAVKILIEKSLEIEVQDMIGANRWEHNLSRQNYRNGYYERDFLSSYGYLSRLKMPRVRSGGIRSKILPRYARRNKDVDQMILEMFIAGVSTRRVEEAMRPLFGERSVSASTVSEIAKQLDLKVERFHRRPIEDKYLYLFFDGVYLKAKSPVNVRRRCVLVAYGIKADGQRELIDYRLVRKGESQAAWEGFLTSLKNRGLAGSLTRMAMIDGNQGLWNALDLIWPDIRRQRCWAHKLRNVSNYVPRKLQESCTIEARDIYAAKSKTEALKAFKRWRDVWKAIAPRAVQCLEEDLEDLLHFYDEPEFLWVKLRTTNLIERVFREVRRRTRPMSCFTNTQSVERIIYAIFSRQNSLWLEKPLFKITHNS